MDTSTFFHLIHYPTVLVGDIGPASMGGLIATVATILGAAVVLAIIWLIFQALDSWLLPSKQGIATVSRMMHTPGHDATSANARLSQDGDPTILHLTRHVPASWHVGVILDNQQYDVEVTRARYQELDEDQLVSVRYVDHRITGRRRVTSLS